MQCNYPNTNRTSKPHFNATESNARITNTSIGTLFTGTWSESNNSESTTNSVNTSEKTSGNKEAEKSDSTDGSANLISLVNEDCTTDCNYVDSKELAIETLTTRRGNMMTLTVVDFVNVSLYVIMNTMNLIVKEIDESISLFLVNKYVVKMNENMRINEIRKKGIMLTLYYLFFRNIYKSKDVYQKSCKLTQCRFRNYELGCIIENILKNRFKIS